MLKLGLTQVKALLIIDVPCLLDEKISLYASY